MDIAFRKMTRPYAIEIAKWRYDEPYSQNDPDPNGIPAMLDPANAYYAMFSSAGELVGFCCFGPDARVPGGDYEDIETTVDIGVGMRPDLTGKGAGLAFVRAILAFAAKESSPLAFRVTVATANERGVRVWEKAGFQQAAVFQGRTNRGVHEFTQLERNSSPSIEH